MKNIILLLSYVEIFEHILLPIARQYAPDLIIVSAGFDSARGDPLGGLDLTEEGMFRKKI
jgi:acetoin utilization deacetylase AcuC-like enzyme